VPKARRLTIVGQTPPMTNTPTHVQRIWGRVAHHHEAYSNGIGLPRGGARRKDMTLLSCAGVALAAAGDVAAGVRVLGKYGAEATK
jgi:hypothetical protein